MKLSIRIKLLAPVVIAIILGTGLVGALSFFKAKEAIRELAYTNQQLLAQSVAQSLDLWLKARQLEMENLATSDQTLKALGTSFAALGARKSVSQRLNHTLQTVPAYVLLALVSPKGQVLASAGNTGLMESFAARLPTAARDAVSLREDGLFDEHKRPLSLFIFPIVSDQNAAGFVIGAVSLSDFGDRYLNTDNLSPGGRVLVTDTRRQLVLLDTNEHHAAGQPLSSAGISGSSLNGIKGTRSLELDGQETIVSHLEFSEPPLRVIILEDAATVMAPATQAGIASMFTSAILALVIATLLAMIIHRVIRPVVQTAAALQNLSSGTADLTARLAVYTDDEAGTLADSFNRFLASLHKMIGSVRDSATDVLKVTEELQANAQVTQDKADEQINHLNQVASAIEQMAASAREIASSAQNAAEAINIANEHALQGQAVITRTTDSMTSLDQQIETSVEGVSRLSDAMTNIGSVTEVINSIAEQTNLLALNAAIEAARAGEQGRGFAVVADEVRTLAQRTQSSVDEIRQLIDTLRSEAMQVVNGIEVSRERSRQARAETEKAVATFTRISQSVEQANEMIQQIASASEEQAAVSGNINNDVALVHRLGEDTAEQAHNATRSVGTLRAAGEKLKAIIAGFRL